jgi:hypothetical protein
MTALHSVAFFNVRCGSCGHAYSRPVLPDMSYGQFVLGTRSGCWTYLDAFAEPAFEQIRDLCSTLLPGLASRSGVNGEIGRFQRVVARLADMAGDEPQEMSAPCPRCGALHEWTQTRDPAELRSLPVTTFKHFASLNEHERLAAVEAALGETA